VEEKLRALFKLQQIDSEIDKIKTIRGELPLEVQDIEDEIAGLETRLNKLNEEIADIEQQAGERKNSIKDWQAQIKKYEGQQGKVRNNREYDSISKELEFLNLEIQLAEKRTKEAKFALENKKEVVAGVEAQLSDKKKDLELKQKELKEIVEETQEKEEDLLKKSKEAQKKIDDRLISAYHRLRKNFRNGLAVVPVERDSCGGCFNQIPPQRQLDIRQHKKILVCEHCGRILVDSILEPEAK
jgi:hypothetical protein